MKYFKFIIVFLIVSCVGLKAMPDNFNPEIGHSGFNGIKWKTPLDQCEGMRFVYKLPDNAGDTYLNISKEPAVFMGFPVTIRYNFYKGQFDSVVIILNPMYDREVLAAKFQKFGLPKEADESLAVWDFKISQIIFNYRNGIIVILNKELYEQYEKDQAGEEESKLLRI